MVSFTRGSGANSNTVEIDFGNEVHYVSPETPVKGKSGDEFVYVGDKINLGNSSNYFKLRTTNINGRPSDDAAQVAEWLRDTFFFGLSGASTGGGEFPADYANSGNQATMIAELQDVEAEIVAVKEKTASGQVTEKFDHKSIVYNGDGNIDYVSYKLGGILGTEVARLTFTYDLNKNITEVTKS
jgi:hypothetical protein